MTIDQVTRAAKRADDKANAAEAKSYAAKIAEEAAWVKYRKVLHDYDSDRLKGEEARIVFHEACKAATSAKADAKLVDAKAKAAQSVAKKIAA